MRLLTDDKLTVRLKVDETGGEASERLPAFHQKCVRAGIYANERPEIAPEQAEFQ